MYQIIPMNVMELIHKLRSESLWTYFFVFFFPHGLIFVFCVHSSVFDINLECQLNKFLATQSHDVSNPTDLNNVN